MIRAELGGDIEDYFDEWDWEPLGAASLAQCHKAKMKGTDDWVAVKVQHAPVKHTGKIYLVISKVDGHEIRFLRTKHTVKMVRFHHRPI